jgi:hypothetical protein
MSKALEAEHDGRVFRPKEPFELQPMVVFLMTELPTRRQWVNLRARNPSKSPPTILAKIPARHARAPLNPTLEPEKGKCIKASRILSTHHHRQLDTGRHFAIVKDCLICHLPFRVGGYRIPRI